MTKPILSSWACLLPFFSFFIYSAAHLPPEVLAKLGPNSRLGVRPDGAPPLRKRHHVADFGQAVPLGDTRNM